MFIPQCLKNEIHLLYLHYVFKSFLLLICDILMQILLNTRRRKVISRRVWLLRSTAVSMTWHQMNITSANQQFLSSVTSFTHHNKWTTVIHRCMNLVSPKMVHLRKLLASVNILREINLPIFSNGCELFFGKIFQGCWLHAISLGNIRECDFIKLGRKKMT